MPTRAKSFDSAGCSNSSKTTQMNSFIGVSPDSFLVADDLLKENHQFFLASKAENAKNANNKTDFVFQTPSHSKLRP